MKLREIADEAGVSIATASRALAGATGISDPVRRRVLTIAARLDYVGRGPVPEVVVHSALDMTGAGLPAFQHELFAGIEDAANGLGVSLSVRLHRPGEGLLPEDLEPQAQKRGHVLLSLEDSTLVAELAARALPAIIVNGFDPLMRLDTVAAGNRAGGYAATRHLIEHGHTNILMLAHNPRLPVSDRFAGARHALEQAGIPVNEDLFEELDDMAAEIAMQKVSERLKRNGDQPDFTAIQCANDASAFGALAALRDAGLSVPAQISVIGFDDIPMAASATPPLTTIAVPRREIGAHALRRVIARLTEPHMTPVYSEFAGRLVVRGSTGPVGD